MSNCLSKDFIRQETKKVLNLLDEEINNLSEFKNKNIAIAKNPFIALFANKKDGGLETELNHVALAIMHTADEYTDINSADDISQRKINLDNFFDVEMNMTDAQDIGFDKTANFLVEQLGRAVLSKLGLKFNDDIQIDIEQRIIASAGAVVLTQLEKENIVEIKTLKDKELIRVNDILEKYGTRIESKSLQVVKMKNISKMRKATISKKVNALNNIIDSVFVKKPRKHKARKGVNSIRRGGYAKVPRIWKKVVNRLQNTKWVVHRHALNTLMEQHIDDDGNVNKNELKHLLGYSDERSMDPIEMAKERVALTKDDIVQMKGKNVEINNLVDKLEKLYNGDYGEEMYFDYFIGKNMRIHIDSNTINPQTNKLMRFLVHPKDAILERNLSKDENAMYAFKYAVVQGLLGDADKKSPETIEKEFDEATSKSLDEIKKDIFKKGTDQEELGHGLSLLEAFGEYMDAKNSGSDIIITAPVLAELDGITNGGAQKAQMLTEYSDIPEIDKNMFGIFMKSQFEGKGKNEIENEINEVIGKQIENGMDDKYKQTTKELFSTMKKEGEENKKLLKGKRTPYEILEENPYGKEIINKLGEVTKYGRTLFKPIGMTIDYAAGKEKLTKNFINNFVPSILKEMQKDIITAISNNEEISDNEKNEARARLQKMLSMMNKDGKKANVSIIKNNKQIKLKLDEVVENKNVLMHLMKDIVGLESNGKVLITITKKARDKNGNFIQDQNGKDVYENVPIEFNKLVYDFFDEQVAHKKAWTEDGLPKEIGLFGAISKYTEKRDEITNAIKSIYDIKKIIADNKMQKELERKTRVVNSKDYYDKIIGENDLLYTDNVNKILEIPNIKHEISFLYPTEELQKEVVDSFERKDEEKIKEYYKIYLEKTMEHEINHFNDKMQLEIDNLTNKIMTLDDQNIINAINKQIIVEKEKFIDNDSDNIRKIIQEKIDNDTEIKYKRVPLKITKKEYSGLVKNTYGSVFLDVPHSNDEDVDTLENHIPYYGKVKLDTGNAKIDALDESVFVGGRNYKIDITVPDISGVSMMVTPTHSKDAYDMIKFMNINHNYKKYGNVFDAIVGSAFSLNFDAKDFNRIFYENYINGQVMFDNVNKLSEYEIDYVVGHIKNVLTDFVKKTDNESGIKLLEIMNGNQDIDLSSEEKTDLIKDLEKYNKNMALLLKNIRSNNIEETLIEKNRDLEKIKQDIADTREKMSSDLLAVQQMGPMNKNGIYVLQENIENIEGKVEVYYDVDGKAKTRGTEGEENTNESASNTKGDVNSNNESPKISQEEVQEIDKTIEAQKKKGC